jgi:chemotaxis protein histidine kinase CheA
VQEDEWPVRHEEVVREMLIHLIRNSMVHGIEPSDERVALGKNPSGLLQLELKSSHPDYDELIFQDDGRGLPYDKIRRRAQEMGLSLESPDELSQAIFAPGFSTADSVTDLAGRGVGLDAIRHALDKIGGKIVPHSEPGAYCAFQVLLPKAGGRV